MSIVKVKSKYQLTIPTDLRKRFSVDVGDIFDARIENGKIIYSPQSLVNRNIAESIEDFKAGRFIGPFSTTKHALKALDTEVKKIKARSK